MESQIVEQDAVARLASSLNTSLNWWIPIPANVTPQERRSYTAAAIALPFALIGHVFFLILFAYWNIPALVIANIISIIIYLVGGFLLRRGKMDWTMIINSIEVIFHSSLVIYFVGWGMGVQYYMFLYMLTIVVSKWPLGARLFITFLSLALFLFVLLLHAGKPASSGS